MRRRKREATVQCTYYTQTYNILYELTDIRNSFENNDSFELIPTSTVYSFFATTDILTPNVITRTGYHVHITFILILFYWFIKLSLLYFFRICPTHSKHTESFHFTVRIIFRKRLKKERPLRSRRGLLNCNIRQVHNQNPVVVSNSLSQR